MVVKVQWFKHMSSMSFDPKVKRTIRRYGVEGYGLYCYILETIARGLTETSPYPELEEMSEDIAADLKMDSRKVKEITSYMVQQGLFDWRESSNRIVCMKMIDYLDEYHRKKGKASPIRKALQDIEVRHCPDKLPTNSGDVAQEKNRIDKNRIEKKTSRFAPDLSFITDKNWLDIFKEWVDNKKSPYRKQIGVEKGFSLLINLSDGDINTAMRIVDKSLANNWSGLFALSDGDLVKNSQRVNIEDIPEVKF